MQRIFMALVLLTMILVAILTAAPLFVDLDGYKRQLTDTIKAATGLEPEINGDVSVSFLPSLSVKVTNVSIPSIPGALNSSLVHVNTIHVKSSFEALFLGKVDIRSIELIHPVVELEKLEDGTKSWDIITNALQERTLSDNFKFAKLITIKNGTLNYREKDTITSIDYISSNINSASANGPFSIDGNFSSGENIINFKGDIGELTDGARASFDLSSDSFSFILKGEYEGGKQSKVVGDINGNVSNLGDVITTLFDESSIFAKVKSDENLTLEGKFVLSKRKFSFSNMKVSSPSLQGKVGVDVLFGSSVANDLQWDLDISLQTVNLDQLLARNQEDTKAAEDEEIDYYAYTLSSTNLSDFNFNISPTLSAQFDIVVDKIMYNEEKISNLFIDTDMFNGKAVIHSFTADLPGNSNIELVGSIEHNGTRPLLQGRIKSSGKKFRDIITWIFPATSFIPNDQMNEYLFTSEVKMTPQSINFRKIYTSVDKTLLTGEVLLRPKSSVPVIRANLKLDRFNLDQYAITGKIYEQTEQFFAGLSKQNFMTSWLRMLNVKYDISLDAKDLVFNGNEINNNLISLIISQGTFNLQRILLNSKKAFLNGSLLIDLMNKEPNIEIVVKSRKFDTESIIPVNSKKPKKIVKNKKWIWSDKPFNFGGIDRFNGNIDIEFNNFKHDKLFLRNIDLKGSLEKKVVSLEKAEANLFGGKVDVKGNIGVEELHPSLGISVLLSNVDLNRLINTFTEDNKTTGKIFFSSVIKTIGNSPSEWMLGLNTGDKKAKIAGRNVNFKNFDLNHIINNSRKLYSVIDMDNVVKKAMNSGSTTFDAIDGEVEISKGLLSAKDFKLATRTSSGVFAGNMSLGNFMMKGIARLDYRPERNKRVSLKIKLDGALDNITKTIDTTELEHYITEKGKR